MKVHFSRYTLNPLKRANRLSSLDQKEGVLIKASLKDQVMFADYFPHQPLGDQPVDVFLDQFKFQDAEYDRKVFDLLLRDAQFQNLNAKKIQCHQLWNGIDKVRSPVIKYKIKDIQDHSFLEVLKQGIKLRLDANGIFDLKSLQDFFVGIPSELHQLIEYIEDPMRDKNWSEVKINCARDFIQGDPFQYYIYKPNCEFKPKHDQPTIYSGYLGSNLGSWHAYCELVQSGDLKLKHGLITFGHYQEDKEFLVGNYHDGFFPEADIVRRIYQDASNLGWKQLCSM